MRWWLSLLGRRHDRLRGTVGFAGSAVERDGFERLVLRKTRAFWPVSVSRSRRPSRRGGSGRGRHEAAFEMLVVWRGTDGSNLVPSSGESCKLRHRGSRRRQSSEPTRHFRVNRLSWLRLYERSEQCEIRTGSYAVSSYGKVTPDLYGLLLGKAVAPSGQLLVEIVEHEIAQEGRERTAFHR